MTDFTGEALVCRRGGRYVFSDLRFRAEGGRALLLTGPNGSGKSSLLRIMAGLLRPVDGRLAWDGQPLDENPDAHRARLAYLGHRNAIKPQLTAEENLHYWTAFAGPADPAAGQAERLLDALSTFDLADLADLPAGRLSSGQQRRLALSRLLTGGRKLWLLDEPTVGLDRASVARLHEVLHAHLANGGLLICAVHDGLNLPNADVLALEEFAPSAGEALAESWAVGW